MKNQVDWKARQAENRRLLEESQKGRGGRNMRSMEAAEDILGKVFPRPLTEQPPPADLSAIARARASACARAIFANNKNLKFKDLEDAAFALIEIFQDKISDPEVIAKLSEGFKAAPPKPAKPALPDPKPEAELRAADQPDLFVDPKARRRVHFVLPYPPSANRYWRSAAVFSKKLNRYVATTYLSEEAKAYKEIIRLFCERHKIEPFLKDVKLTAYLYRPQKSGDLGNRLKVVEDALENIAYLNDSQIVESHHFRRDDKARPRIEIFLEEV